MRFDIENQLCVGQAFTATAVSANSYQKGSAAQDLSIGSRMALLVAAIVAAGAGSTHVLEAIQADDAALTTNVTSLGSITVLAASLIPGHFFEVPIPQGVMSQKYLGFRDTITGGTTTVTLDVYLVPQGENPYFKSFVNVTPIDI